MLASPRSPHPVPLESPPGLCPAGSLPFLFTGRSCLLWGLGQVCGAPGLFRTHFVGRYSSARTRRLQQPSPHCFAWVWARGSFCAWVLAPLGSSGGSWNPAQALGGLPLPCLCPLFNLCLPQFPHGGSESDCGPQ